MKILDSRSRLSIEMLKKIAFVIIALSVVKSYGENSLMTAEEDFDSWYVSQDVSPWRRFWGGPCDSDDQCSYVISYCHFKRTGKFHFFLSLISICCPSSQYVSSGLVVCTSREVGNFLLRFRLGLLLAWLLSLLQRPFRPDFDWSCLRCRSLQKHLDLDEDCKILMLFMSYTYIVSVCVALVLIDLLWKCYLKVNISCHKNESWMKYINVKGRQSCPLP